MTEWLNAIKARLQTVDQLELVITAMRSIAAARARDARARLAGVAAYAQTVGTAIGEALALLPDPVPPAAGDALARDILIALSAEQGFAGAFSANVLARVGARLTAEPTSTGANRRAQLMLVGDRGLMTAAEQELQVDWSAPMAAHPEEIPALADRIAGELFSRLAAGGAANVTLIHAEPDTFSATAITEHALLPFDYSRFPVGARTIPPLVSLPPERLAVRLAEEYVFAELSAALIQSYAAENEARMRAMISARSNVRRTRASLRAIYHCLRQEQITTEIVELAAARAAGEQHASELGRGQKSILR